LVFSQGYPLVRLWHILPEFFSCPYLLYLEAREGLHQIPVLRVRLLKLNIMSNENKSIHEFDFSLICEYFSSIERQGPGSPEVTVKALSFIDGLTPQSHIADVGCGTGETDPSGEHPGYFPSV